MSALRESLEGHPAGERAVPVRAAVRAAEKVDTFGGTVHVEWDPDAATPPLGHLAFFAEYLKVSGRFDALVADCPLHYRSPNAPSKRDVLGTVLLSVLAGQWRYAHITALRGDGVNATLLGMSKVASEDFGSSGPGADRGGGGCRLAARPSRRHGAAFAERALGSGLRHDDQAALRSSGGGGVELQPEEAGASPRTPTMRS